jgi:hypothetical protein
MSNETRAKWVDAWFRSIKQYLSLRDMSNPEFVLERTL